MLMPNAMLSGAAREVVFKMSLAYEQRTSATSVAAISKDIEAIEKKRTEAAGGTGVAGTFDRQKAEARGYDDSLKRFDKHMQEREKVLSRSLTRMDQMWKDYDKRVTASSAPSSVGGGRGVGGAGGVGPGGRPMWEIGPDGMPSWYKGVRPTSAGGVGSSAGGDSLGTTIGTTLLQRWNPGMGELLGRILSGRGGAATVGQLVRNATGSSWAGNAAWRLASTGAGGAAISGAGWAARAAIGAPGVIAAGAAAWTGLASHLYQTTTGTDPSETWWARNVVSRVPYHDTLGGGPLWRRYYGVNKSTAAIAKAEDARAQRFAAADELDTASTRLAQINGTFAQQNFQLGGLRAQVAGMTASTTLSSSQQAEALRASMGNPGRLDQFQSMFQQRNAMSGVLAQFAPQITSNLATQSGIQGQIANTSPERVDTLVTLNKQLLGSQEEGARLRIQEFDLAEKIKQLDIEGSKAKIQGYREALHLAEQTASKASEQYESNLQSFGSLSPGEQQRKAALWKRVQAGEGTLRDITEAAKDAPANVRDAANLQLEARGLFRSRELGVDFGGEKEAIGAAQSEARALNLKITTESDVTVRLEENLEDLKKRFNEALQPLFDQIKESQKALDEAVKNQVAREAARRDVERQQNEKSAAGG